MKLCQKKHWIFSLFFVWIINKNCLNYHVLPDKYRKMHYSPLWMQESIKMQWFAYRKFILIFFSFLERQCSPYNNTFKIIFLLQHFFRHINYLWTASEQANWFHVCLAIKEHNRCTFEKNWYPHFSNEIFYFTMPCLDFFQNLRKNIIFTVIMVIIGIQISFCEYDMA